MQVPGYRWKNERTAEKIVRYGKGTILNRTPGRLFVSSLVEGEVQCVGECFESNKAQQLSATRIGKKENETRIRTTGLDYENKMKGVNNKLY